MTKLESINFNTSSTGTSWENLLDLVYPKGSVYFRTAAGSAPGNNFGGQWSTLQSNFYPETLYTVNGVQSSNNLASFKNTDEISNKYVVKNNILYLTQSSWNDKNLPQNEYTLVATTSKKNYQTEIKMFPYFHSMSGVGDYKESTFIEPYNNVSNGYIKNGIYLYNGNVSPALSYWAYSIGIPLRSSIMTQTYIHQRTS